MRNGHTGKQPIIAADQLSPRAVYWSNFSWNLIIFEGFILSSKLLKQGYRVERLFKIVIQEVLLSIRGSYAAIWTLPLTNNKWHSEPWPVTVNSQSIRLSSNFDDFYTGLNLHRITSGFHGAFLTVVASQQRTLTLPDTCFLPPFGDLLMLQLLKPVVPNLRYLFLDISHWMPLGTFSIVLCTYICLH